MSPLRLPTGKVYSGHMGRQLRHSHVDLPSIGAHDSLVSGCKVA